MFLKPGGKKINQNNLVAPTGFEPVFQSRSVVEMRGDPEVLDLVLEELPVGRVPIEVLEHPLELAAEYLDAFELEAPAQGYVRAPVVLLTILEVRREDRSRQAAEGGPGALKLEAVLDRPRLEARWIPLEEIAGTGIYPEHAVEEIVRKLGV